MSEAIQRITVSPASGKARPDDVHHRWTVIGEAPSRRSNCGGNRRYVLCRCECGTEKEVSASSLVTSGTRSCGCLKLEGTAARSLTHGESVGRVVSTEYKIWTQMRYRCSNPNDISYPKYGGRGISVCEKWRNSFAAFLADMGRRPSKDHSIDRIDNDENYEPRNCRWATRQEQGANKRTTYRVVYEGRALSLHNLCKMTGHGRVALRQRLDRGMSGDEAVADIRRSRAR